MPLQRISDIDSATRAAVRELVGLDPVGALEYFDKLYVGPLSRRMDLAGASLLDCACGVAWLSVAAKLRGAGEVVAADLGAATLERAKAVLRLLDLEAEVPLVRADVTRLPFSDRRFDVVASIETLEHVPIERAMAELERVCGRFFVLETIHRHFPIDTHDTPYPLVHLLPTPLRRRINRRCGKHEVSGYPSLAQVEEPLRGFVLQTPFKTFQDVEEWEAIFPFEHPYQAGRRVSLEDRKWRMKRRYYRAAFSLLGKESRRVLDKIMGIYERG
jgi:ubiquinone/menaquinone biosynthesis C-methylase UbiE